MTIFHVLKYNNDVWYRIINDLPSETRHQFWAEYSSQPVPENINQVLKDFLLRYEDDDLSRN